MVCAGSVGAVFCLEASRLARNGLDWHRLLELCGLVGARVVDADGIYDPRRPNDRLLLGMKGTINEFELGVLRARMNEALWAKARRGELRIAVPTGFQWEKDGGVQLDPNARLQEVIRLVFRKFHELGSARQATLWMRDKQIHFPRPVDGKRMVSFEWALVRYRNVISVLKNPFYAGVYAYGKSAKQVDLVNGRPRKRYGRRVPMKDWAVFIRDHHAGYIEWEEYQRVQEQLARNNYGKKGTRAKSARGGRALLAGLLRCRRCARRLQVAYAGRSPSARYWCNGKVCLSFASWAADGLMAGQLLNAVAPLAIEAAVVAEGMEVEALDEHRRIRELELEQARYDARLAERRYAKCDPDNRLVASQLERRWEDAMRRVRDNEAALGPVAPKTSSETDLSSLALDLGRTWNAPQVAPRTRQRLVRALVEEIVVDIDQATGELVFVIHWKGGVHSEARTAKPGPGQHARRAPEEAIEIVRRMAGEWSDEHIASTLNRLGYRTGHDNSWTHRRVQALRSTHAIRAYKSADAASAWITMSGAAKQLDVSRDVIRRLIRTKALPAQQVVPRAPYQIRVGDLESERVRGALGLSCHGPCGVEADSQQPLFTDTSGDDAQ
jgi:hypothetical protein